MNQQTTADAAKANNANPNAAPQPPAMPPIVTLQRMMMGAWVTKALWVAAKYHIPDLLSTGPKSAEELAEAKQLHAPTVSRVMRALCSVGAFESGDDGRYALTPVGEFLRTDVPGSMHGLMLLYGDTSHWGAWDNIDYSVETGLPAFEHKFGSDFFTYAQEHPETAHVFDNAMTSLSGSVHKAIAASYDFSGINTLMDVGGGHGTLLAAILQDNPHMRGILFDQPHVVEGAPKVLEKWGVADRCEVVGGNFFESLPTGADACILASVIHDWSDDLSLGILKNCRRALSEGGKLLLSEWVIPEGNGPHPGKFLDLNMLVMTTGGRERTETEFRELLAAAGYRLSRILPTSVPVSIVESVRESTQ